MLSRQCRSSFDPVMLSRGMDYFRSGRVLTCSRSGKVFELKVRGIDGTYDIRLDFENAFREQRIDASCSCPFYEKGNLCKHIWASILRVDSERVPELFPQEGVIAVELQSSRLEEELLELEGDDNDDDDYDDESDESFEGVHLESQASPQSWSDRISHIQKLQNQSDFRSPPSEIGQGRPGAKIAYYRVGDHIHWNSSRGLVIEFFSRDVLKKGGLGVFKPWKVSALDLEAHTHRIALEEDRELISWLLKVGKPAGDQAASYRGYGYYAGVSRLTVEPSFHIVLLPRLAVTGRLLKGLEAEGQPIRDDSMDSWDLEVVVESTPEAYVIRPRLVRGAEIRLPTEIRQAYSSGFIFYEGCFGRLSFPGHYSWILSFQDAGEAQVPRHEIGDFMQILLSDPRAPKVFWPPDLKWTEQRLDPRIRVVFSSAGGDPANERLWVELSFEYPGQSIPARSSVNESVQRPVRVDSKTQTIDLRNLELEARVREEFNQAVSGGLQRVDGKVAIERESFPRLASQFIAAHWEVLAQGKTLRVSKNWEMSVSSGVNWFDLAGKMDFEGHLVEFPELLEALKNGGGLIELGDGTVGILPEEWLSRYTSLAQLGQIRDDSIRFQKSHGLFLDAWLSGEHRVRLDQEFRLFQKKIRSFEGIKSKNAPATFRGKLRPYQKEGLAWFGFAEEFGLGGVLADDMGLGKTVQFLAFLLDYVKRNTQDQKPSLVIAPKSLVFNWMEESARFSPKLKVLNYTGKDRALIYDQISESDLVITTYPVVRADIQLLKHTPFELAVVDEAQAIKNPKAQTAQACKSLQARHRFAMTGTPIENSLEDLFSILEFTSPGFLDLSSMRGFADDSKLRLAQALRPIILRRTKTKVLKELPEKTEQTVYCQMSATEERRYVELRDHYRANLLSQISEKGFARSKLHVLEALLRLRQAACHPGLLDSTKLEEPSAKLEHLLEQLRELVSEGHKALVFSQFTSLLAIVQAHLKKEGIRYEYLDGKTENRQERVRHFQSDSDCPVFLISLKAGGTGLNLTAASYVFLLDPWWNPAVEAQAIDRAHRIGQSRKVFAYRMIARGTVEEKILELQKSKRDLAEAIISEEGGFLKKMTREDLELLLS